MHVQSVPNTHPELLALCVKLDAYLNLLAGGEESRRQYIPHNQEEDLEAAFLVLHEGAAIGCAGLKKVDSAAGEVKRMYVEKSARRKGAGGLLMEALEAEAKARGYTRLLLETGEPLQEALRLYARYGYGVIPPFGPYAQMEASPYSICMGKAL